jgi:hypothetical protein
MSQVSYEVTIPVAVFRDGDAIVAYTPALNVGSCGRTQSQALNRLKDAVNCFFAELVEMGTLDKALKELGWKASSANRLTAPRTSEQPAKIQRNIPTHPLARRSMNVALPAA